MIRLCFAIIKVGRHTLGYTFSARLNCCKCCISFIVNAHLLRTIKFYFFYELKGV